MVAIGVLFLLLLQGVLFLLLPFIGTLTLSVVWASTGKRAMVLRLITSHIIIYLKMASFYLIFWFLLMLFFDFVTKVTIARLSFVVFVIYESILFFRASKNILKPPKPQLNTNASTSSTSVS